MSLLLLPWKKKINDFCQVYPFWKARVVMWRPSSPFGIKIWLNDGNLFIFWRRGKHFKLISLNNDRKKGKVVYDSAEDGRKGI